MEVFEPEMVEWAHESMEEEGSQEEGRRELRVNVADENLEVSEDEQLYELDRQPNQADEQLDQETEDDRSVEENPPSAHLQYVRRVVRRALVQSVARVNYGELERQAFNRELRLASNNRNRERWQMLAAIKPRLAYKHRGMEICLRHFSQLYQFLNNATTCSDNIIVIANQALRVKLNNMNAEFPRPSG